MIRELAAEEIPLTGGRTTSGVVRAADTVRRPQKAASPFVHKLLTHLELKGFKGAPRFLGIDASAREILSYIPGRVPTDLGNLSDPQISAAARLLRAMHDATVDCELKDSGEVICHGDASPCNCVFVHGLPAAFIDFDAAHAGRRRDDTGYAAWLWIDIGNPDTDAELQGRRLADWFTAYGGSDIHDAVAAVIDAQTSVALRPGAPRATRIWADGCREWTERNREKLAAACTMRGEHHDLD